MDYRVITETTLYIEKFNFTQFIKQLQIEIIYYEIYTNTYSTSIE